MCILDTFLFSEAFERTLLLAKPILKDPGIDRRVAIENSLTFRGEYKGRDLKSIIASQERFEPFRDKIHVMAWSETCGQTAGNAVESQGKEARAFVQEISQREAARSYLLSY